MDGKVGAKGFHCICAKSNKARMVWIRRDKIKMGGGGCVVSFACVLTLDSETSTTHSKSAFTALFCLPTHSWGVTPRATCNRRSSTATSRLGPLIFYCMDVCACHQYLRATNIYVYMLVRVFSGRQSVCQCCAHAPARLLNTCRLQPTNLTRFLDQKLNELNKLTIEVGGKLSLEYNCTKGTTHGSILIKPDLG